MWTGSAFIFEKLESILESVYKSSHIASMKNKVGEEKGNKKHHCSTQQSNWHELKQLKSVAIMSSGLRPRFARPRPRSRHAWQSPWAANSFGAYFQHCFDNFRIFCESYVVCVCVCFFVCVLLFLGAGSHTKIIQQIFKKYLKIAKKHKNHSKNYPLEVSGRLLEPPWP